jgi:hypothetical protein
MDLDVPEASGLLAFALGGGKSRSNSEEGWNR